MWPKQSHKYLIAERSAGCAEAMRFRFAGIRISSHSERWQYKNYNTTTNNAVFLFALVWGQSYPNIMMLKSNLSLGKKNKYKINRSYLQCHTIFNAILVQNIFKSINSCDYNIATIFDLLLYISSSTYTSVSGIVQLSVNDFHLPPFC